MELTLVTSPENLQPRLDLRLRDPNGSIVERVLKLDLKQAQEIEADPNSVRRIYQGQGAKGLGIPNGCTADSMGESPYYKLTGV